MSDQVRVAAATGEPDLTATMPDLGAAGGAGPIAGGASPPPVAAPPVAPAAGMDAQFVEAIVKLPFIVMGHRRARFPIVGELGGDPEIWYLSDKEAEVAAIPTKVYIDRMLATTGISGTLAGLAIAAAMLIAPRIVADVIATSERVRASQRAGAGPATYRPADVPASSPAPTRAEAAPVPGWAPSTAARVPDTRDLTLPTGEKITVKVNREEAPSREEWFK